MLPCTWAGKHAKAMEQCSDADIQKGVSALLAAYPAIPCPATATPRIIRSSWGSDPLFRGSYSYVNAAGSPDDIDTLAAPLTVTNLSFHDGTFPDGPRMATVCDLLTCIYT